MPLNLQLSENSVTQVAETVAVGGTGLGGSGGDATAVTNQNAMINDNDYFSSGPDHFGWGPDYGSDLGIQVSVNPVTQVATTVAVGGPGLFGNGGDAIAVTNQDAMINDNDFMSSF